MPWISEYSGKTGPVVIDGESQSALDHVAKCGHYRSHADAALIAAARNALPGLLDTIARIEALCEEWERAEERWKGRGDESGDDAADWSTLRRLQVLAALDPPSWNAYADEV